MKKKMIYLKREKRISGEKCEMCVIHKNVAGTNQIWWLLVVVVVWILFSKIVEYMFFTSNSMESEDI